MKMTYKEVLAAVIEVTATASGRRPTDIHPDDSFVQDLALDSLGLFEVVVDLEDRFKLQIKDEEVDRLETPADAAALVISLAQAQRDFDRSDAGTAVKD